MTKQEKILRAQIKELERLVEIKDEVIKELKTLPQFQPTLTPWFQPYQPWQATPIKPWTDKWEITCSDHSGGAWIATTTEEL